MAPPSPKLIDACQPWDDVLSGKTGISALAVDLDLVTGPRADKTLYGDPEAFFKITHPTTTMVKIIQQVFSRITGRDPHARGIFLLGTAMGGGKTHILTALFHLAKQGSKAIPPAIAEDFIGEASWKPIRVAVLTHNAPAGGERFPRTLWGGLAEQLGRADAIRDRDKLLQAPTKDELAKVLEGGPVLILMDEITNYIIRAATIKVGGTTLAEQTRVFLQLLEEVIDEFTTAALVVSQLPEEFNAEEKDILSRVTKGLRAADREEVERRAKKEARIAGTYLLKKAEPETPVRDDDELVSILRKRLFEGIQKDAADKASQILGAYYQSAGVRAAIPVEAHAAAYRDKLRRTYPFHPRTITILRDKLSQAPKFMQTRGAVYLSVLAVRRLHQTASNSPFIYPFHIDPRDPTIMDEIAARVFQDERLQNAVVTELVEGPDEPSRASLQDGTFGAELGSRLTTAILLESALVTEKGLQHALVGAPEADVLLDVLQPGEDETRAREALRSVLETTYHIVPVGEKLVFQGEVNLNRYIDNKAKDVGEPDVRSKAQLILRTHVLKGATFFDLVWEPTSPEDIRDHEKLRLVVLPPTDQWWHKGEEPNEDLERLFNKKNQSGETRRFKNTVVFLVPSATHKAALTDLVRRQLAVRLVNEDANLVRSLSPDQLKQLEAISAKAEGTAILRVGMAYKLLFYPWHKGDQFRTPKLACAPLTLNEQQIGVDTETWKPGRSIVLEIIHTRLEEEGKVKKEPFSPAWVKDHLFTDRSGTLRDSVIFKDMLASFSEDTSLPFPPKRDLLERTIEGGIDTDAWGLVSARRLFTSRVTETPVVHEDSELVLVGTARYQQILESFCERCGHMKEACKCAAATPPPPPEKCPACRKPKDQCVCEMAHQGVILKDVATLLRKEMEKRKSKVREVAVTVSKPKDVALVLKLISSLGGAKASAEVATFQVEAKAAGEGRQIVNLRAESPGSLWAIIKGTAEGLLGQISSGKATGNAKVDLLVKFKAPASAATVEEVLQPFSAMPGCEKIKADVKARPEGEE